jgi:large subunit ribosomal protein L15
MSNFLSQLPKIVEKKKKRLGRGLGSGRGAKSGRGTTRHQKARGSIPIHFEGGQGRMVKKFPLLRGKGKNKSIHAVKRILSLSDLQVFKAKEIVTTKSLIEKKIISEKDKITGVKILNKGKVEKALIVKVPLSKSAKAAIEKAGGRVEV